MSIAYISFQQPINERLDALRRVVTRLAEAKSSAHWPDDEQWLPYFDSECMKHFWHPTKQEKAAWFDRWTNASYPEKLADPSLQIPWDFSSLLEAIKNSEYQILGIKTNADATYDLQFEPYAHPFGGTDALSALIEAFDCILIGTDDGSGYTEK